MTISPYQIKMLILSVIITVIFYGVITFGTDFDTVRHSFKTIGIYGAVGVFGLSLLNYLLRFVRWNLYINVTHKNTVPVLQHLMIYLSGFALTTTPAKAGEAIRGVFLQKYGINFQTNIACFFSERLSDLLAILILCLWGIADYNGYNMIFTIGGGLIAVLMGLVYYPQIILNLGRLFQRSPKIHTVFTKIYDILVITKIYHQPVIMSQAVLLSVLSWGCEAYGFYYMIDILGFDNISLYQAVFIYSISMLVGGLSFIPGGLGSSEAVMIGLLVSHDIPLAIATAMTLFTRIATLWFAVIIGLVCLGFQSKKANENIAIIS